MADKEVEEIMLYNYPKTDGLGFLDLFLGHIEELLKCQPELIKFLKNETETLKDEFYTLRSLLKQIKDCKGFEDIRTNTIHLAYQAENVIDSYLVYYYSEHRSKFTLSKILEKIKLIQSEATRINGEKNTFKNVSSQTIPLATDEVVGFKDDADKTFNNIPSQAITLVVDAVVGFKDEAKKIMDFLVSNTKKRDVISIVGLPGLGKTTLARKLFEDPLVIKHFDIRAWCTVSQTYRKRDVLLTILSNIERIEEMKKLNDEDLVVKLYKNLKGHRYLIVIDDIWNIEDWNDLSKPFPDDKNQSRIIITSRIHNVASHTKVDSKLHLLREFTDSESWELFEKKLYQNKLFNEGKLSKNFKEVGKKIVKRCKGLPLAIVVIASLLSKQEKTLDKWKEISANLSSQIFNESESQFKAIFELSYNDLPDPLKSCLLYFGAFAEDEEILLSKLKRLWIAEGFVRETDAMNLEDIAEKHCMDLISRSLLIPVEKRSSGGVKSCRVHDLVHEFCLKKAKEESFLQVISMVDELKSSSIYDHHSRLKINSNFFQFLNATPYGLRSVRSLFSCTRDNYRQTEFHLCYKFKLLRVLDLGNEYRGWHLSDIERLIHLKYLHISIYNPIMPITSSISKLWNLQFLCLKVLSGKVSVPDSLWDMVHLRNVNITFEAYFEVQPRRLSNSVLLDDLNTLTTPCLCYGEYAENLLRRLPKLQKLSCIFYIEDSTTELPRYPVLDFLDQLTSLKVFFKDEDLKQKHIELNFPLNLKKVSLACFKGYWDDISKIGRILPNLEVLKLVMAGKEDDIWVLEDENFQKLKCLKLYRCNCEEWIASEDCFPVLEKLVLRTCLKLKKIPPHFGDLTSLEIISVHECRQSLCDSVREVQKNQEEYGNSELKVNFTHTFNDDNIYGYTGSNTEEHNKVPTEKEKDCTIL